MLVTVALCWCFSVTDWIIFCVEFEIVPVLGMCSDMFISKHDEIKVNKTADLYFFNNGRVSICDGV